MDDEEEIEPVHKKLEVIFDDDEIIEEIDPLGKSEDKGVVINPTVGKRDAGKSDLVKEITALDALTIGASEAARINGVVQSSASKYANGNDIADENTRARVLDRKFGIQDVAITKLMESLNILDPSSPMKIRDRVAMTGMLATVVDKLTNKDSGADKPQVHLHLYGPAQKKESEYQVIDV